jgi:hypothetical protein
MPAVVPASPSASSETSSESLPTPPARRRPGPGAIVTVVNGVLAGIGGVYASTHSILITIVAGVMAIVLAVAILIFQR